MIVFVLYAAVVWYLAFRFRRHVLGFAIALLSLVPPLLVTALVSSAHRTALDTGFFFLNNLRGYGAVLHVFSLPYAAVVTGVAFIAVWQARERPHITCPKCHYDLEGNATGQCPECGHILPPDFIHHIARIPARPATATLPSFSSEEEARLAGERSVRRISLPEHLIHAERASAHDPLKHGAQRLRPHATTNRAPRGHPGPPPRR